MAESINQRVYLSGTDQMTMAQMRDLLAAMLADLTALRATVAANVVDIDAIAAKLDADGGVTDTDYQAGITAAAPSALTTTS